MTTGMRQEAKGNATTATGAPKSERSIATLPTSTRSAPGRQPAAVAQRKRTGGSSPETNQGRYDEARRRDLPGRSQMSRAELAWAPCELWD